MSIIITITLFAYGFKKGYEALSFRYSFNRMAIENFV